MISPFLISIPETPYPIPPPPASMRVCPPIPLYWGIEPSWNQGPLLPLMPGKAILCYIHGYSHGSLHVYSLIGGLDPESSGWLILLFFLLVANPFSNFSLFSNFSIGNPVLSSRVGSEHLHLYMSGSGRASQEIARVQDLLLREWCHHVVFSTLITDSQADLSTLMLF